MNLKFLETKGNKELENKRRTKNGLYLENKREKITERKKKKIEIKV